MTRQKKGIREDLLAGHSSHKPSTPSLGFGNDPRGWLESTAHRLRSYAHLAANLGAVETVAGPPSTTSHVESTKQERAAAGIPEALIRYSVGIEDAEDLIADLGQALDKVVLTKQRRATI
jgi:cystathionine beta-lyase/cystathionine gamma-synthase